MKRYILIALILAGILLALQFASVHASSLRDWNDWGELTTWLEQDYETYRFAPPEYPSMPGMIALNPDAYRRGMQERAAVSGKELLPVTLDATEWQSLLEEQGWSVKWFADYNVHELLSARIGNSMAYVEPMKWWAWYSSSISIKRDFRLNAYNAFGSEVELQNFLAQDGTNEMMFAGKSHESICAVYATELKLRARLSSYDIEVYPFTDKELWAKIYPNKPFIKHLMNVAIVDNGLDAAVYLIEPQTDEYWELGDIE